MIIVKIFGGLGNQMFQYAFGKALSLKYNRKLLIDTSYFNKENYPFDLHADYYPYKLNLYGVHSDPVSPRISQFINIVRRKRLYYVVNQILPIVAFPFEIPGYIPQREFSYKRIEKLQVAYIEGYWQGYNLLENYSGIIREELTLKNISDRSREIFESMKSKNTISVHFRRGDYVSNPKFASWYAFCPMDYYDRAIDYIGERVSAPNVIVFSDDIKWVKDNFAPKYPVVYVDDDLADVEALYLMSQCSHHIIANSSFSWWGAWLNSDPQKIVIAPKNWFAHQAENSDILSLIPTEWIRL